MGKFIFTYIAWIQAAVATVGSLFFSEVLKWTPCTLCWYQRILMYPLVWILLYGTWKKDPQVTGYVLPISLGGAVLAMYHYLLQRGVIQQNLVPCGIGGDCQTQFIGWFGFITIPLLSFIAFTVISVCMMLQRRQFNYEK